MSNIIFHNLEFSAKNGAVLSMKQDGRELLSPAKELFSIQFLDEKRDAVRFLSSDFPPPEVEAGENLNLRFSGCAKLPGTVIELKVSKNGKRLSFRPKVNRFPCGWKPEWIDIPQIITRNGQKLFTPFCEGVEICDFSFRTGYGAYHELGFPVRGRSVGGLYPNSCQMQFLAAYDSNGDGFYFGAEDSRHTPKAVEYESLDAHHVRLSLQTFCGDSEEDAWCPEFEYILQPIANGWRGACRLYRDWVTTLPEFATPVSRPEWMKESPVIMIYAVRGNGDDHGNLPPNEYYPYSNAMPVVRKYAGLLDSKIMSLLMHWEGTAPWAPPYVWPPYGGTELLADYRDQLRKEGHLLGVYCSGSAWTQTSSITNYSCEEQCRTEGLERFMMRGPKGEIDAVVCNGKEAQRLGYDLCLTEEWSRKTILDEIGKLSEFGFDYTQFFDQNIAGGTLFCYSREHTHPEIPGSWLTDAMRSLQEEMLALAKKKGSAIVLGTEAAAATPYVPTLTFNDTRSCFVYYHGIPVPAYSYVFHTRACNFMGNQCGINWSMDHRKTPWNLFYRTAYAFHCGDLLSILLGPNGSIFWNWGLKWDFPIPEQEPEIRLLRELNTMRKRFPEFLLEGQMEDPVTEVRTKTIELIFSNRTEQIPPILSSIWRAPNGKIMEFFTNFLNEPVDAELIRDGKSESKRFAPLETFYRIVPENLQNR